MSEPFYVFCCPNCNKILKADVVELDEKMGRCELVALLCPGCAFIMLQAGDSTRAPTDEELKELIHFQPLMRARHRVINSI